MMMMQLLKPSKEEAVRINIPTSLSVPPTDWTQSEARKQGRPVITVLKRSASWGTEHRAQGWRIDLKVQMKIIQHNRNLVFVFKSN